MSYDLHYLQYTKKIVEAHAHRYQFYNNYGDGTAVQALINERMTFIGGMNLILQTWCDTQYLEFGVKREKTSY